MKFRLKRFADEKKEKEQNETPDDSEEVVDSENVDNEVEDVSEEEVQDDREEEIEEMEEEPDMEDDRDESVTENSESQSSSGSLEDMIMSDGANQADSVNPAVAEQGKSQTKQIADRGREVIESIEEYKFFVDQMTKSMSNNPALAEVIDEKKSELESASQKVYDLVYEMENMDVLKSYQDPLMGIPNSEPDTSSFGAEPENFTDDLSIDERSNSSSSNNDSDLPDVDSPNDLLDMMSENDLEGMFSELEGIDEDSGEESDNVDDTVQEDEEDIAPPSKSIPKQPKVDTKSKPKK